MVVRERKAPSPPAVELEEWMRIRICMAYFGIILVDVSFLTTLKENGDYYPLGSTYPFEQLTRDQQQHLADGLFGIDGDR